MLNILVIDDEANIRKTLALWLKSHGRQVCQAGDVQAALAESRARMFEMAFLDLRLGADNGLELIPKLLADSPWMKIVVMTAYSSIDTAVQAMRLGAFDYIAKPFNPEQIELVVGRVEATLAMQNRIDCLKADLQSLHPEAVFSSANPKMQRTLEMARQVADSEAVVLLRGESGTGKTMLARAIHNWSRRAEFPLGIISCPTLTPELLSSELFGHMKGAFTGAVRDSAGRWRPAITARFFWMRSATCRRRFSRSCCASFRTTNTNGSGEPKLSAPTCGSSPRPTWIWRRRCGRKNSARISSTG